MVDFLLPQGVAFSLDPHSLRKESETLFNNTLSDENFYRLPSERSKRNYLEYSPEDRPILTFLRTRHCSLDTSEETSEMRSLLSEPFFHFDDALSGREDLSTRSENSL